ncbi:MAG: glycosyl transferase [Prevotella sp.]|nr:glycosyl transferase [Prevotella sp.]
MSKILKFLKDPLHLIVVLMRNCGSLIANDETYLRWYYALCMHKKLNLESPGTYNEKINWLKLHDHNPLYTTLVDKLRVKDYVTQKIGAAHVIKTLGIWKRAEDIEWDNLPERFVLKTTQGGGNIGVMICHDKSNFDRAKAIANMNAALKQNLYSSSREWPYKDVEPLIFAEEYMEDEHGELRDYKFFCFDGKCRMLFVATERQTRKEPFFNFFDDSYHPLPFRQGHPLNPVLPEKPKGFQDMVRIAEQLSVGFPHVRVDLYIVNGQVYFGEYTFYHFGGVVPFEPAEWDGIIGSWLTLPQK